MKAFEYFILLFICFRGTKVVSFDSNIPVSPKIIHLLDPWEPYVITDDASKETALSILKQINLKRVTCKYDRKIGRRLLSILPSELEQIIPDTVVRTPSLIPLQNGTHIRVNNFPLVDWNPLFMSSVLGVQELAVQLMTLYEKAKNSEIMNYEDENLLANLLEVQSNDWISSANLRALLNVAIAKNSLLQAKIDGLKRHMDNSKSLSNLEKIISDSVYEYKVSMLLDISSFQAEQDIKRLQILASTSTVTDERIEKNRHRAALLALETEFAVDSETLKFNAEIRRKKVQYEINEKSAKMRENIGANLVKISTQGSLNSQLTQTVIHEIFTILSISSNSLSENPSVALKGLLFVLIILFLGILVKVFSKLVFDIFEWQYGSPPLVRKIIRIMPSYSKNMNPVMPINALKTLNLEKFSESIDDFGNLALETEMKMKLLEFAGFTRSAVRRKAKLNHLLLYGPPGTGKSLTAQHVAHLCGLDCVVISGADIAPLGNHAVSSLHRLFGYLKNSYRKKVLIVDEADICFHDRNKKDMSIIIKNCLNTVLYYTGELSSQFLMILTTSRPNELDNAILDRIDVKLGIELPSDSLREHICDLSYFMHIHKHSMSYTNMYRFWWLRFFKDYQGKIDTSDFQYDNVVATELVRRTEGLSCRDIDKILLSVQSAVYGSEQCKLTESIWTSTIQTKLKEYSRNGCNTDMAVKAPMCGIYDSKQFLII